MIHVLNSKYYKQFQLLQSTERYEIQYSNDILLLISRKNFNQY